MNSHACFVWLRPLIAVSRNAFRNSVVHYALPPVFKSAPKVSCDVRGPRAMTLDLLPSFIRENYELHEYKHATAILKTDFPDELRDIVDVLSSFRVFKSHIVVGGGGKSKLVQALERPLRARGWEEKQWETKIIVDRKTRESPTHKVDCYKNSIALE